MAPTQRRGALRLLPRHACSSTNSKRRRVDPRFQTGVDGCFGRKTSTCRDFIMISFCQCYRRPVKYKPIETEKLNPMKTDQQSNSNSSFPPDGIGRSDATETKAPARLRTVYPGLGEIIRLVLDEEEAKAWGLSTLFPASLSSRFGRGPRRHARSPLRGDKARRCHGSNRFFEIPAYQPALALCG